MKILLLAHIRKRTDNLIVNSIRNLLVNAGYNIDRELVHGKPYDCIVVFNRKHLNLLKNKQRLGSIPVVYVFYISDATTEFIADPALVDHIIVFRDQPINIPLPLYEQSSFLYMINSARHTEQPRTNSLQNRKSIYVDVDQGQYGDRTLHTLLGFLNLTGSYDICCFSENKLHKPLMGKLIRIVKDSNKIDEYIDQSDIIIGSGYSAMRGIQSEKKVIIIGERGYGGLVTTKNIRDHYLNYFQGRNGGQIGEFIPTNLLQKDLEFEPEGYDKKETGVLLHELIEKQQSIFIEKIEEAVKQSKLLSGDVSLLSFRMNTDFAILKSNGYKLNLINKHLYNIHKRFNESECVILLDFKEPTKIEDVLNKYPAEYKSEIMDFIESLIRMKLILPFEDSTITSDTNEDRAKIYNVGNLEEVLPADTTVKTSDEMIQKQEVKLSDQIVASMENFSLPDATNETLSNKKMSWYFIANKDHQPPFAQRYFDIKLFDAFYLGDVQQKEVYLTFDVGYENGNTSIILDVLKEKSVEAAFFLTKPYVEKNTGLVKRMIAEGHLACNHTVNHKSMPDMTDDQIKFEIKDYENFFKDVIGVNMAKYIRPPMGEYSCHTLELTKKIGYKTIFWSFAYKDWIITDQPGKEIAYKAVMDNLHNGAIILLHAISQSNTEALLDIIDSIRVNGYIFKTLDDLPLHDLNKPMIGK